MKRGELSFYLLFFFHLWNFSSAAQQNQTKTNKYCALTLSSTPSPPITPGRHRATTQWPVGISHVAVSTGNRIFVASGRQWDPATKNTNYLPSDLVWWASIFQLTQQNKASTSRVTSRSRWNPWGSRGFGRWTRWKREVSWTAADRTKKVASKSPGETSSSSKSSTPPASLRVSWHRETTFGASPWEVHDACAVEHKGKILFFGGQGRYLFKYHDEISAYDPHSFKWKTVKSKGASPAGRQHMACVTNARDDVVVFGGWRAEPMPNNSLVGGDWNGSYTNQLLSYAPDSKRWSNLETKGPQPGPRSDMAFEKVGNFLYIHGGLDGDVYLDDFWKLDLKNLKWEKINTSVPHPGARHAHSLTSIASGKLLLVGGMDQTFRLLSEVWLFDLKEGKWEKRDDIPAEFEKGLSNHKSASIRSEGKATVVVIGGHVVDTPYHPKRILMYQLNCGDED